MKRQLSPQEEDFLIHPVLLGIHQLNIKVEQQARQYRPHLGIGQATSKSAPILTNKREKNRETVGQKNSLLPNTIPRPYTKGLHSVQLIVWELLRHEEPLRFEAERVAKVALRVIHQPLRHAHDGALRHEVARDVCAALGYDSGQWACHGRVAAKGLAEAGEHCENVSVGGVG